MMRTYLVKLIFQIQIGDQTKLAQFDEQTILIAASNLESAFNKARIRGKNLQEKFLNENDKEVSWKFIDVTDIFEINQLKDGDHLYSKTHEAVDPNSYIQFVQHRSQLIQTKLLNFI